MKILTAREEAQLDKKELAIYYNQLREHLLNTPHYNLSKGSLTICPIINGTVRQALLNNCGYDIIIDGNTDVKGLVGIYSNTHQSKFDHVNFVASNPNHTILLNSSVLSPFFKAVLNVNGVVYVNKSDKDDKIGAKLEMIRLLLMDKSVTMFPESAWNMSPNKIHLPLYAGIVDIAKKTGKPIIPVVQEYTYETSKMDGIERVKKAHIRYGDPIFVNELDNSLEKLDEYSEQIATMRWDLMSEKGIHERKQMTNEEYINFIKGCIRNLKNAGIDINVERQGILGANNDFYLFHHINDVPFDENGELIPTEHVIKLEKIYRDSSIK